jgi:hypothetical protein
MFLAALRTTGLTAPLVVDGALNGELFLGWIIHHLVPTLQWGDIVVMDNLGAHKVAGVACLGNPDPGDMKVYCPTGKETFDDDETTEEAPS